MTNLTSKPAACLCATTVAALLFTPCFRHTVLSALLLCRNTQLTLLLLVGAV
jgi:hypothetical protein